MAVPVEGIQGRGKAGIFGTATNPLHLYMQYNAGRQKRQEELEKEDRERRDAMLSDLRKFNPGKVWEPFYDEANRYIQEHVQDRYYQLRGEGKPLSFIERELQRAKGDADTLVNKINWQEKQFNEYNDRIDQEVKDGNFVPNYYQKKLNDRFFNGKYAKPSGEIAADHDEIFDDVSGYNVPSIVERFMKSLPDMINADETEKWGKLGVTYDIQQTKDKLGLQFDANGNVIIDPRTNRPAIAMTDEVFGMASNNPYLKKIMDASIGTDASIADQKSFMTGLLRGYNPVEVKNSVQLGHKIDKEDKRYYKFGYGFRQPIADLEDRYNRLNEIVNNNRPDLLEGLHDPNSDIQAYYADSKGNPVREGQNPAKIVLAYVGLPEGNEMSPEKWEAMSLTDKILYQQARGKVLKKTQFDISTEENKRKARIAMSNRLDKIHAKTSIGEEYSNFEEAMRKEQSKSQKKKSGYDPNDPL